MDPPIIVLIALPGQELLEVARDSSSTIGETKMSEEKLGNAELGHAYHENSIASHDSGRPRCHDRSASQ